MTNDNPYISREGIDLTGRTARCSCGRTAPSSTDLAFFEYRGLGMERPTCAICGFYESVHAETNPYTGRPGVTDHTFMARVDVQDAYYCGCRGWD